MALIAGQRNVIARGMATATKCFAQIPMNRVYENTKTGEQYMLTNDYSVARNGINDRKQFVVYYPEKFAFCFHKRYDQMKYSAIDLITKFDFATPGTDYFRKLVNTRTDVMSAVTLITDTDHSTDNTEYAQCYHQFLMYLFLHDDFTVKLLPPQLANFQQQFTEKLKNAQKLKQPQLFDKSCSNFSSREKLVVDEANKIILVYHDLMARIAKHCSATHFEFICANSEYYANYSVAENNFKRQTETITLKDYLTFGNTGFEALLAIIDHNEPFISMFDPWKRLICLYGRLFNDVISYRKELDSPDFARFNGVQVFKSEHTGMSERTAITEIMRIQNKILNDLCEHVEYVREEEKYRYIKYFTQLVGFSEGQWYSDRYGLKRVSGTEPMHETLEYNGVVYANY